MQLRAQQGETLDLIINRHYMAARLRDVLAGKD